MCEKTAISRALAPLLAITLAACGATGGGGAERQSTAEPVATSAVSQQATPKSTESAGDTEGAASMPAEPTRTPIGPEPTSCPHGKLIPAVEIPAVRSDPVVIPEARIGGEVIPEVVIPGVDIPAQRIPAQCTEIEPAPGGCLGAASIPPVSIPAVELPPVEIPGVDAGGIKLDPVRAEGVSAPEVRAEGVSTPEVCQVEAKEGERVPYVRRPYIRRPYIRRPYIRRPYISRPRACNEQRECVPSVRVPSVQVPSVQVPSVQIPSAHLTSYVAGKSDVLEGENTIAFSLKADVLFDFDSAEIKPAAAAELKRVARQIAEKAKDGSEIRVDGHTDAKGDETHNRLLSERRAQAVADWLVTRGGIDRSRLRTTGYGESKPVAPNTRPDGSDDPDGRAKNRRVVIGAGT